MGHSQFCFLRQKGKEKNVHGARSLTFHGHSKQIFNALLSLHIADSEAEDQGNDCLYTVIGDIIANHNLVVENRVHRLLPECSSLVFPLEVTANHAVIGSFSE